MNRELIRLVPLFSRLPDSEIDFLSARLRHVEMGPAAVLFREGEHGDRFYFIREGQVEVVKALGTADEHTVSVRGTGEYIGEMSLFNPDGLRTASVRTRTPVTLLEMTRGDFDALLARRPALAYDMVRVLSMRLNQANNAALEDLRAKNRQLRQAYDELKEAQAQIIIKEKLEHELKVAREVQASLLPRIVPHTPGWELAAHWQPAREVAGDFYDFMPGQPGQLGLVIADVADKGMPSALFMALSRSILRASMAAANTPADGLARANRLICDDSSESMFVTLCYAFIDMPTGSLTYLNAGHNPPLLCRAAADHTEWLAHTGMPLGIDAEATFGQRTLTLYPGDCMVFYTDGIPDAINDRGEDFGAERLRQAIRENRKTAPAEMLTSLKLALKEFVGDSAPADDIAVVIVKRL